jgi:hypothetical protein
VSQANWRASHTTRQAAADVIAATGDMSSRENLQCEDVTSARRRQAIGGRRGCGRAKRLSERCCQLRFAAAAGDGDLPAVGAEHACDLSKTLDGPPPRGQLSARMDEHEALRIESARVNESAAVSEILGAAMLDLHAVA